METVEAVWRIAAGAAALAWAGAIIGCLLVGLVAACRGNQ